MRHRTLTLAVALTLILLSAVAATASFAPVAQPLQPSPTGVPLPPGAPPPVSLQMLASREHDAPLLTEDSPSFNVFIDVARIPIAAGESHDGRDLAGNFPGTPLTKAVGTHLLYVEQGEITLARAGEEASIAEGGDALVPSDEEYVVRNDSDRCASLLRLAAFAAGGFGAGVPIVAEGGPPRRAEPCGKPEHLATFSQQPPWTGELPILPWPTAPLHWFFARAASESGEGFISSVSSPSGPTALLTESGSARGDVAIFIERSSREVSFVLPADGSIGIASQLHWNVSWQSDTSVLIAGILPATDHLLRQVPPQPVPDNLEPVNRFELGAVVVTSAGNVRLRAEPSTAAPIVAELPAGTRLTVTGPFIAGTDDAVWYPVANRAGRRGYVFGTYLAEVEAAGG